VRGVAEIVLYEFLETQRKYSVGLIGVDSGGQPGHAPPIIKMWGQILVSPPIMRGEFFICYNFKKRLKKAETKTEKYKGVYVHVRQKIFNEGCKC